MANIKKFLEKGEKHKITKTKSFRLAENAFTVLEMLAESTNSSQNEILNEILDDYYKELAYSMALEDGLEELKRNPEKRALNISKYDDVNNIKYQYTVFYSDKISSFVSEFIIFSTATDDESGEEYLVGNDTLFDSVSDLLGYGIDSTYSTFNYSRK